MKINFRFNTTKEKVLDELDMNRNKRYILRQKIYGQISQLQRRRIFIDNGRSMVGVTLAQLDDLNVNSETQTLIESLQRVEQEMVQQETALRLMGGSV